MRLAVFAGALVSGCVSVQNIPLAPSANEALRGREATIAVRDTPDFAAFTPAAPIFGAIGGAASVVAGNNIVKTNRIDDPAVAIARALAAELTQRYAVSVAPATVRIASDDVQAIAKSHPSADLLLDVRTINWSYVYYPTSWGRYRVIYTARVRLIDIKRASVIAEGPCSRIPDDAANAPSQEELLANGAQRLKSEIAAGAQACLQQLWAAPFAFAGPVPALAGGPATVAAAQPSQQLTAAARIEAVFWESIRASAKPDDFRTYLEQYPNGMYVAAARERLADLEKPAVALHAGRGIPSEGDTWTYRLKDSSRNDKARDRRYEVKVTSASASEVVERYTIENGPSGEWKHSSGAYLVRLGPSLFSPYLGAFNDLAAQPVLGDVAPSDPMCGGRVICDVTAKVVGREVVDVPAGRFEAVKVTVDHRWGGWRDAPTNASAGAGSRELHIWYAPVVKRAVKFSSRSNGMREAQPSRDFELELESYQLK